jgi:hypothetical protein
MEMNATLLIDAIVRETTVLIAQLSTAAGLRAPLANIAEQVFLQLSREIESQGVPRKVVADMFGLALRGYQKKVQRLTENTTSVGGTLWSAIVAFIQQHGEVSRRQLLARFRPEDPTSVGAVISDLVHSGLVERTGSGDASSYRIGGNGSSAQLAARAMSGAASALIWATVYRNPGLTRAELAELLGQELELVQNVVGDLLDHSRITERQGRLHAELLIVPVGADEGWEAALFDHYHAVVRALSTKLRIGKAQSRHSDVVGGATLTFDVHPAHPRRAEVYGLLASVRLQLNALWEEVEAHNREHPVPEGEAEEVCFYFGQSCHGGEDER